MMQRLGFALPIALSVPGTVLFLSSVCSFRVIDSCHMTNFLTKELFWRCSGSYVSFRSFAFTPQTWIWLTWLISQVWITIHLWTPKHERLARSEKLFILPYYVGAFVDQSLAFNRRRDDKAKIKAEDLEFEQEDSSLTYETIPGGFAKPPPSVCSVSSSRLENGLIRLDYCRLFLTRNIQGQCLGGRCHYKDLCLCDDVARDGTRDDLYVEEYFPDG